MSFRFILALSLGTVAVDCAQRKAPQKYVVLLKDHARISLHDHFSRMNTLYASGITAGHIRINGTYEYLNAYNAIMSPDVLLEVQNHPEVLYVEEDKRFYAYESQANAPWGLARTSTSTKFSLTGNSYTYSYDKAAGEGVNVYVIDTGVNQRHLDFEGRAVLLENFSPSLSSNDNAGHGTHCAGVIGGKIHGIAKKSSLFSIKALGDDGSGSLSSVLKSVEFAIKHSLTKGGRKGNVASMSLGAETSSILNEAIKKGAESGMVFVVAAGNEYTNACQFSPASSKHAITVGATDMLDQSTEFSNYGECVDVYAPGKDIKSAWKGSETAVNTISGTSMAAPHVAGLAAYVMSLSKNKMSPEQVRKEIIKNSLSGVLRISEPQSPNLLINNNYH